MSFFSKARGTLTVLAALLGGVFKYKHEVDLPVRYSDLPDPVIGPRQLLGHYRGKKWSKPRGRTHRNMKCANGQREGRLTVKYPANGPCP